MQRYLFLGLALTAGCVGLIGGNDEPAGAGPTIDDAGKLGARRLTRTEYIHAVNDAVGVEVPEAYTYLPDDAGTFANDYRSQVASSALIEALQQLAELVAERALADADLRDELVGCAPAGPSDTECMRSFVESAGRRILRRPLVDDDIEALMDLQAFAVEQGDFYEGVSVILRALLQHPSFVYRMELGEPVPGKPGLARLTQFEVASRLSFFLAGTTPDETLLDLAAAGELGTPDQVRQAAARLLETPRARDQVHRFHAAWLGFTQLQAPSPELMESMQAETTALIDRVIFDSDGSWLELFRSSETFVDDRLAEHYGLPLPGGSGPDWVSYGDSGRAGVLSHASFLSNGVKFGDTSPTQRGIIIRTRLLCETVPPPPPDVAADDPPGDEDATGCKADAYKAHSKSPTCNSCHHLLDPLGFGLESFDGTGRYRTVEAGNPDCDIDGEGELPGVGPFRGPAELSQLLIDSGTLEECVTKQVFRFAFGREEEPGDAAYLASLTETFSSHERFDQLLLDFVSRESFGYRLEE